MPAHCCIFVPCAVCRNVTVSSDGILRGECSWNRWNPNGYYEEAWEKFPDEDLNVSFNNERGTLIFFRMIPNIKADITVPEAQAPKAPRPDCEAIGR